MRLHQLTEAATAVLYHSTTPDAAIEILESGQFLLSDSSKNNSEMILVPRKGWNFFLSTARTPLNVFANDLALGDAVTFKMNGSWFNVHGYIVRPVNWVSDDHNEPELDTAFTHKEEAEDRVFSRTRSIPITPIIECHVLIRDTASWKDVKIIEKLCQRRGIPCWIYDDKKNWMQANTNKRAQIGDFDIKAMKKRKAAAAAARKTAWKAVSARLKAHPEQITKDDIDTWKKDPVVSINPRVLLYWPEEPSISLINMFYSYLENDDQLFDEMWEKYPTIMKKLIDARSKIMWNN